MSFFKDIKDAKEAVHGAPGMIQQGVEMQQQADQMMAAQAAAGHAELAQLIQQAESKIAADAAAADLTAIAGVSLDQYAAIAKALAAVGFDQSQAVGIAGSRGVSATSWSQAMDGWNGRIVANASIAKQFNQFYTGA